MSGTMDGAVAVEVEQVNNQHQQATAATDVVIFLGPAYENAAADQLEPVLAMLGQALGGNRTRALVAYPVLDAQASAWELGGMSLLPYLPSARLQTFLVQTATAYVDLYEVMRAYSATCGLLLGAEAQTLQPVAVAAMLDAVMGGSADLAIARYAVGPNEALINASMLHPVSRALFGVRAAFPLALDLAISNRMAQRMAANAQNFTASSQPEAIVWVTSEAAVAGYTVAEVNVGTRELPHATSADLSEILHSTAAALFSDVEARAAFWQRLRPPSTMLTIAAVPLLAAAAEPVNEAEIAELIASFRIGYGNLHEIWSLVLPPQTLLGLKRLSAMSAANFVMTDALWVRIVYDFVLAHRLRTINRNHLLGSFTPLYLAWVASHLLQAKPNAAEDLARTFEADKPYLVSRWRWPDRFNP